jgi:hypothetical protein
MSTQKENAVDECNPIFDMAAASFCPLFTKKGTSI